MISYLYETEMQRHRLNVSCFRLEGLAGPDVQSEDDQGTDTEHDPLNWQQLVGREVLAGLRTHEIKRQEVINGEISICWDLRNTVFVWTVETLRSLSRPPGKVLPQCSFCPMSCMNVS